MTRLFEGLLILVLILMFFSLAPVILWILKLILALGFLGIAYDAIKQERWGKAIIFILLAILFQPIMDVGFGKAVWYVIQLAVIVWLLTLIFKED